MATLSGGSFSTSGLIQTRSHLKACGARSLPLSISSGGLLSGGEGDRVGGWYD